MLRRWLEGRAESFPAPISIPPAQTFDGNDGPWSSFPIQIGTPPQTVKILPSTKGSQTWAVLPQGCIQSDPANCTSARGGVYQPNSSSTWSQNQGASGGLFPLELERNLGDNGNGLYGYDTVVLGGPGSNGPSLIQQAVAGIATKAFYLGVFGLNPNPVTLPATNNQLPDFISSLNTSNLIPSLSWSYTAGNQYRPGPVYGSLILGGQDTSRFEPNDITFPFNKTNPNLPDLLVNIGAIFLNTSGQSTTLQSDNETIDAFVDSTTPYIILPVNVCEQFEIAFGLKWDSAVQAYLVNDTLHQNLSSSDTSVVFNLGNASTVPGQGFNISLPYSAFDLIASAPLLKNQSRYFPLMRAANGSQITLGRTFLQEAYVTADYERKNFSVSQCTWETPQQAHIISITRPGATPTPTPSHSLSGGAIAGIVIGVLVGLAILILLGIVAYRQYQSRTQRPSHLNKPTHIDLPPAVAEIDSANKDPYYYAPKTGHTQSPELDAVIHKGHELDSGVAGEAETDDMPEIGEGQEHPIELDATDQQRRSRMLRSISSTSGGTDRRRSHPHQLHQREGSDGVVSITSPVSDRPAHTRQESDTTELDTSPLSPLSGHGEGFGGMEGNMGHSRDPSDAVVERETR